MIDSNTFVSERDKIILIQRIVDRATYLGGDYASRLTMMLDLELAYAAFQLRLEDLLNAPTADFLHDVSQIGAYINRATKTFDVDFVPRYAGKEN